MINFKKSLVLVLMLCLVSNLAFASTFNSDGEFSVELPTQKAEVFNDDIDGDFKFTITNNRNFAQDININMLNKKGWDLILSDRDFTLKSGESRLVTLSYSANSDFEYNTDLISPDEVKISQLDDYIGVFEFPIVISGNSEEVSVSFQVLIDRRGKTDYVFDTKFASNKLSPASPMGFTITSENLDSEQDVTIKVELGSKVLKEFQDTFSPNLNYKVYQTGLDSTFEPGIYEAKITIRLIEEDKKTAQEWFELTTLEVVPYSSISDISSERKTIFRDRFEITLTNNGNVADVYEQEIKFNIFKKLLFSSNFQEYETTLSGIKLNVNLESGETKKIAYSFNFLPIYIILIVIVVILSYIIHRKTSNPLDVETELYEIKKDVHEGVKSMKIKIGFENIKESEIDVLKIIFRMPSYLQVKDESFLLTEPNHVLKGSSQFKLEWDFKRFERNDSRIIGFELVNKKGILGDIRLPDLEVEVKVNGKVKRYYTPFEIVRG